MPQYAQPVAKKGKTQAPADPAADAKKLSNHAQRNLDARKKGVFSHCSLVLLALIKVPRPDAKIDSLLEQQFGAGRLYAAISSRPGQSGRADGYILEGKELEVCLSFCLGCIASDAAQFYLRKIRTGKQKHAHA